MFVTLTLYQGLALPYESLLSHASINKKLKEMKMKRNINNNLAVLPSHDSLGFRKQWVRAEYEDGVGSHGHVWRYGGQGGDGCCGCIVVS